jgi:hypothetical protein
MKRCALLLFFLATSAWAGLEKKVDPTEKAPSKEQVLWTETDVGYDLEAEYAYAPSARTDFGNGATGRFDTQYSAIRHIITRRTLMAFLLHTGGQWQRLSLYPPRQVPLPNSLNSVSLFLGTDLRWSGKDMMRIQVEPGFYSDLAEVTGRDLNAPLAIAYTRITSDRFQWTLGLSYNAWRGTKWLGGGGFRYYINDRWKLIAMLPTPQIEYRAADALHLSVGADFRGDTYRVSSHFGHDRNDARLDNGLVDYQEMRVGAFFSWNVFPLIELNGQAGWIMNRTFDYHEVGLHSTGQGTPYVLLNLRALFQLKRDRRPIKAQIRSMQYRFPILQRFFQ